MCLSEVSELMHIAQHEDYVCDISLPLTVATSPKTEEKVTNRRYSQRCSLF
jgi:hypothetical protein